MTEFSGILTENRCLCVKVEFEKKFHENEFQNQYLFPLEL